MVQKIICPGCSRLLQPPAAATTAFFVCPHCQAQITHPDREPTAAGLQTAPNKLAARPSRCPSCGAAVESLWNFCGACQEPLNGFSTGRDYPPLKLPESEGTPLWHGMKEFLPALGGFGILLLLMLPILGATVAQSLSALGGAILLLVAVVAFFAIILRLFRDGKLEERQGLGLIFYRFLTTAGVLTCLMLCIGAVLLVFATVCIATGGPF